jgi:hypothetical protein
MTLTRRKLIGTLTGGIVGAVALGANQVSAAPAPVTMWMLDPDWNTPLATAGGGTKSKCKGSACRKAAPHRFFLTQADAIAGRLHPGCLAQPKAVLLNIDLNAMMPFYSARHGGIDGRCPTLPAVLGANLYRAETPATPADEPAPAQPVEQPAEAAPAAAVPVNGLPVTGSSVGTVIKAGAVIGTAGVVLTALGRREPASEPS